MSHVVEAFYPAATMREFASEPIHHPEHDHISIAPPDANPGPKESPRNTSDSQNSLRSNESSIFSAPAFPSSSSNLSTSTIPETDLITPALTHAASVPPNPTNPSIPPSPQRIRNAPAQLAVPRTNVAAIDAQRTGDTAASPMSIDFPASQGFKRTADGSVKGTGLGIETAKPIATAAHKRNKSMDTHGGRIGELSAQLKTRLSYAMVKVQNGWEKQSLEELEEVHSQRGSPNSAPGRSDRLTFESPSILDRQRRPSGVSDGSDAMIMSPASDPVRSLAATPSSYWRPGTKPAMHAAANLISITGAQQGVTLGPAPDIHPARRRRSSTSHAPPAPLGQSRKYYSDLSGMSQQPVTPRAGILRMPSQQAEKDAVDTLLFMSSPNNSQRMPHTSQTAPSPLRAGAPQRRVMFDTYPPQEYSASYHSPIPGPSHQQHEPSRAYPAQ